MSATELFGQIKALADVDWRQAHALAEPSNLIVRIIERDTHAVLAGVDRLGRPQLRVNQRQFEDNYREFADIEPTGHVWEPTS
jgi:hypothetical protein